MKKMIMLLALLTLVCNAKMKAQVSQDQKGPVPKDTADYPYYVEMMLDENINFFAVQRAFNKYYVKHHNPDLDGDKDEKHDAGEGEEESFALYKRWEYTTRRHMNPDGSRIPKEVTAGEVERYRLTHPDHH